MPPGRQKALETLCLLPKACPPLHGERSEWRPSPRVTRPGRTHRISQCFSVQTPPSPTWPSPKHSTPPGPSQGLSWTFVPLSESSSWLSVLVPSMERGLSLKRLLWRWCAWASQLCGWCFGLCLSTCHSLACGFLQDRNKVCFSSFALVFCYEGAREME